MANDIDPLVYRDNDENIICTPTIKTFNVVTGALESNALVGRTDGVYFLSTKAATDPTATAIHDDLIVTLTESTDGNGVYYGVQQGSDKTARMSALSLKAKLYRHWKFGEDYHESVLATLSDRTAVS